MSFLLAASLIAFRTFFSSLSTSAKPTTEISTQFLEINPSQSAKSAPNEQNRTSNLALDVTRLLTETPLPHSQLLLRRRLRLQQTLHLIHHSSPLTPHQHRLKSRSKSSPFSDLRSSLSLSHDYEGGGEKECVEKTRRENDLEPKCSQEPAHLLIIEFYSEMIINKARKK